MSINVVRVINQQTLPQGLSRDGSILLAKIDRSQGNSDSPPYAQNHKQKVYVPYANPLNTAVKGYVDLVQTDEVKLAAEPKGSIGALTTTVPARVAVAVVSSSLIQAPVVSAAPHALALNITGTTFLSVAPDLTYVELTNASGVKQLIPQASFTSITGTLIVIPGTAIVGTPATTWKVRVFANSKYSNLFSLT
jgi:hypothetical protein